jgi:hypothetical protein
VLDLVHLAVPAQMRGRNLFEQGAGSVFSGGKYDRAMLVEGGYKYYRHRGLSRHEQSDRRTRAIDRPLREELYELATDPHERKNLIDDRPEIAAAMRAKVDARLAALPARRPKSAAVDEATARQLRALGYLGD